MEYYQVLNSVNFFNFAVHIKNYYSFLEHDLCKISNNHYNKIPTCNTLCLFITLTVNSNQFFFCIIKIIKI